MTETKSWKTVPITVDETKHTYTYEGTLPEGDYYYTYPGYRCLTVEKKDIGVPVVFHGVDESAIYCYAE